MKWAVVKISNLFFVYFRKLLLFKRNNPVWYTLQHKGRHTQNVFFFSGRTTKGKEKKHEKYEPLRSRGGGAQTTIKNNLCFVCLKFKPIKLTYKQKIISPCINIWNYFLREKKVRCINKLTVISKQYTNEYIHEFQVISSNQESGLTQ